MPTSPRFLLRRAEAAHRRRDLRKGMDGGHSMVDDAKPVGSVEEGHPRRRGGVAIPLGVPDVQGVFQPVAGHHQGDVLRLGLAGAAGVFKVGKILPQAVGLEKGSTPG